MKSWKISLGSALHMDVLSGPVREEVIGQIRIKNVSERHSFGYFSFAVERKVTRRQGRNTNDKSYTISYKREKPFRIMSWTGSAVPVFGYFTLNYLLIDAA